MIGVGNPLRSDDGLGSHLARKIAQRDFPGVKVVEAMQLDLEVLEDARDYARILVIDASSVGDGVVLEKIVGIPGEAQVASSHHLSPQLLVAMAKTVYGRHLELFVCSIRGQNFEIGESFSPEVTLQIPCAEEKIEVFLKEG